MKAVAKFLGRGGSKESTNKCYINSDRRHDSKTPVITMTREVMRLYRESIAKNTPETFALLGGYFGNPFHITDFYFLPPIKNDTGSYVQSAGFVYPDHDALNYIIDRAFVPNGKYMMGLWHSHPGGYDRPSVQDLDYCGRIIASDDSPGRSWRHFLAPITTFTPSGADRVSAWVLDRNGAAFYPAEIDLNAKPAEATTLSAEMLPVISSLTSKLQASEPEEALGRLSASLERRASTLHGMEAYHFVAKLNQLTARLDNNSMTYF